MKNGKTPHFIAVTAFVVFIVLGLACASIPHNTLHLYDGEMNMKNLIRIEIHPNLGRLINLDGESVSIISKQAIFLPSGNHKFDFSNITVTKTWTATMYADDEEGIDEDHTTTGVVIDTYDYAKNFPPNSSWLLEFHKEESKIEAIYLGKLVADEGDVTIVIRNPKKSNKIIIVNTEATTVFEDYSKCYRGFAWGGEEVNVIEDNYSGGEIPLYFSENKETYSRYSYYHNPFSPDYTIKEEDIPSNKVVVLEVKPHYDWFFWGYLGFRVKRITG